MPTSNIQITVKNAALLILIMLMGLYLALGSIFSLSYIKDSPESRNAVVNQFDSFFITNSTHFSSDSILLLQSKQSIKEISQNIEDFYKYKVSPTILAAPKSIQNKVGIFADYAHDSLITHFNY